MSQPPPVVVVVPSVSVSVTVTPSVVLVPSVVVVEVVEVSLVAVVEVSLVEVVDVDEPDSEALSLPEPWVVLSVAEALSLPLSIVVETVAVADSEPSDAEALSLATTSSPLQPARSDASARTPRGGAARRAGCVIEDPLATLGSPKGECAVNGRLRSAAARYQPQQSAPTSSRTAGSNCMQRFICWGQTWVITPSS
jgi:hypothetical protein